MDISAALATDLTALTETLDHDLDLETRLQALIADVKSAIASYLALTMTITLEHTDVSFTVGHDTAAPDTMAPEIGASLLIPLAAVTATDAGSTLALYAATPGAFVDLAADLSYALNLDPLSLILDQHLAAPAASDGITGLAGHHRINQAIGVLIAQGHTPESAHEELHRLAALDHGDLHAVAEAIVLRTSSNPTDTT